MIKLKKLKIYLSILIVLQSFTILVDAQNTENIVDDETYEKAIDLVFPLELNDYVYDYAYLIRIKPSFDSEQLTIIVSDNGKITVTTIKPIQGNLFSFFSTLINKEGIESAEKLAERVNFKKTKKTFLEKDFEKFNKQLSFAFNQVVVKSTQGLTTKTKENGVALRTTEIIIDGTSYEVKFLTSQRESLILEVYDHSLNSKTYKSPLSVWIKSILDFVENKSK